MGPAGNHVCPHGGPRQALDSALHKSAWPNTAVHACVPSQQAAASTDMDPQAESSTLTPCASATASAGEAGGCNQGGPRRTVNAAPAHHEGHQFPGARQEGSTCRGAMSAGAKRRNINHRGPGALPAQSYHRTANPPHLRARGQRRSRLSSIAMGAPMPHGLRRRDCSTPCGVFCG